MAGIDSLTVCNPRQAKKFIERSIIAGTVPFLTSSPGMGKSSIVRQIAEEYGMILIDHRLSTSAPEDLSGLPRFKENGRAEFAPFDDLFPLEGDPIPDGANGWLLFLDEFNSAKKEVQAAAYKLILDRMTGQKKLHPNVAIVCAGNKSTDRAITNPLSTAMQSRVVHLEMELDFDLFIDDVAIPYKWDERIMAFLNANQSKLMDFRPDHQEKTFCCPRTWDFVNMYLKHMAPGPIPVEDTLLFAGTITSGTATEFVQFTQVYDRMVKFENVLKDPKGCALPSGRDLSWATVMYLANQTTLENFPDVAEYVNRMELIHKILFFRTVNKHIPDAQSLPEWRYAAIALSKYVHG